MAAWGIPFLGGAEHSCTVLMAFKGCSTVFTQAATRPLARPFLQFSIALASLWEEGGLLPPFQGLPNTVEENKKGRASGLAAGCVKAVIPALDTTKTVQHVSAIHESGTDSSSLHNDQRYLFGNHDRTFSNGSESISRIAAG